jgi:hypothetical protein
VAGLPAVLCIDIEPDDREVDRRARPRWSGFEQLVPRVAELRDRLTEITGAAAHFQWGLRMDPQIADVWGAADWAAVEYENELRALLDAGDELGLHTHSWRWSYEFERWIADKTTPWVRHSAETALAAYKDTFGRACSAHRFGDRYLSDDLVDVLTKAEVTVDLTLEPGFAEARGVIDGELGIGMLPDTRFAPRHPYRPAADSFLSPDAERRDGPLLVPLTDVLVIKPEWSATANAHLPKGHTDVLSPIREPGHFRSMLERHFSDPRTVHVAMAVRSDDELAERWSDVVSNLEAVAARGALHGLRFTTAPDAAAMLDAVGATQPMHDRKRPMATEPARAARWSTAHDDRGFAEGAELEAIDALASEITTLTSQLQREQIDTALVSAMLADKEDELGRVVEELVAERDKRVFAEFHLELLQSTKILRMVAPLRRAYGWVRARVAGSRS